VPNQLSVASPPIFFSNVKRAFSGRSPSTKNKFFLRSGLSRHHLGHKIYNNEAFSYKPTLFKNEYYMTTLKGDQAPAFQA
jgi:hypothetical protein